MGKSTPDFDYTVYLDDGIIYAMSKLLLEVRKKLRDDATNINKLRRACRDLFAYIPGDVVDKLEEDLIKSIEADVRRGRE